MVLQSLQWQDIPQTNQLCKAKIKKKNHTSRDDNDMGDSDAFKYFWNESLGE